ESIVQSLLSTQISVRQNFEQPSQPTGVPTLLSQVSGNSTTPLPHTGQGFRHPVGVSKAVHVVLGCSTGAGWTSPAPITGGLRLGKLNVLMPSRPNVPVIVASTEPFTVSCSCAVMV